MINNFKYYIDFLFYFRGFLAFIFVPIILLFNIFSLGDVLLYSNVYLNNYRFPNLKEPFYYCGLYFFMISLFLILFNLILNKINLRKNFFLINNVKNINFLFIFIFLIILTFKLRVLNNMDYFNNQSYLSDLLLNNFYTNFIIHFFLPNELVFILFSLYFDKIIKNKFVHSFFIIYFILTLTSIIIFRSRFLLIIGLIMLLFLLFKYIKKINFIKVIIFFIILIFFLYTFIPFDLLVPSSFANYFILIFDHLTWRLDSFHLVDLGFRSGDLNVISTNEYGRNYGIITMGDNNTGIEFPFFYYFIKINNSLIFNSVIIIMCSFVVAIFYETLKFISLSLGNFFFIAFLFQFSAHWPEMSLVQFYDSFLKLIFIYIIIAFYIFVEKIIYK